MANNTIIHNFPLHKTFFRNALTTDLGFHCHIFDAKFICVFMIHLRQKFKILRELVYVLGISVKHKAKYSFFLRLNIMLAFLRLPHRGCIYV